MRDCRKPFQWTAFALTIIIAMTGVVLAVRHGTEFFSNPDRRGQRLMADENYQAAAETFVDPYQQAAAFYRAGDFKQAASIYGGLLGEAAAFNHANSLVMLGKYQEAVPRYDRALELRPQWDAALANRAIALGRSERLDFEGGDSTGGQLGADEIVFSDKTSDGQQEQDVEVDAMSDEELRGLWLRQVQTTPREFLRSKFAYQQATRQSENE